MPWLDGRVSRVSLLPLKEAGTVRSRKSHFSHGSVNVDSHHWGSAMINENITIAINTIWTGAALLRNKHGSSCMSEMLKDGRRGRKEEQVLIWVRLCFRRCVRRADLCDPFLF